jgi:hypothetical protein
MCCKDNLKILEFGCGNFSSKLLSWLKPQYNLQISSFESDINWIKEVQPTISYDIYPVDDWNSFLSDNKIRLKEEKYDVAFVDQAPWEARHETIKYIKDSCEYIILHDCDYYPYENIFQYSDYFKYWKIFLTPEPWPWRTGPPTLLASNYSDCNIDILYERILNERNI